MRNGPTENIFHFTKCHPDFDRAGWHLAKVSHGTLAWAFVIPSGGHFHDEIVSGGKVDKKLPMKVPSQCMVSSDFVTRSRATDENCSE